MKGTLQLPKPTKHGQQRLISVVLQFVLLFAFWLLLSGHYQARYIVIGALAAGLVTLLSNDLFYLALRYGENAEPKMQLVLLQLWRFLLYLPWLLSRIIMANIQVAYLVLHPKMPIDPGLLVFRTRMKKGIAQVTLANSITLTPGTITTSLENGRYIIHTLKRPLAGELEDATMQNKIARVYLEAKEPPPTTQWVHSLEEIK
ncbi:MAG TPA: Na+/H+ antiporter subunit E [Dehalococcoidales bacterium]|nr:Na+/H+ antiporter subunit E [Dehalococcoidales bacterium]